MHQPLPADPAAATLFIQARDDWAARSADSLNRSVQEFERVTVMSPRFAPGFAGLADAYLLAGEAGSLPAAIAYDGARHAAEHAGQLDPDLAAAHRAIGFVEYWWEHDPTDAGPEFRKAISLDPAAAQTHFWYANVLADNGEDAAAMREFGRARLTEPGSDQIGADFAWALWIAGHDDEAAARLRAIVTVRPDNEEAQDSLSLIAVANGDYRTYLQALRRRSLLRQEPAFTVQEHMLDKAYAGGGGPALLKEATSLGMADEDSAPYPDHALPAFYASLSGDFPALVHILQLAVLDRERWGSAGFARRIRVRWRENDTVATALARLSAPPMEGSTDPARGGINQRALRGAARPGRG